MIGFQHGQQLLKVAGTAAWNVGANALIAAIVRVSFPGCPWASSM